MDFEKDLDAYLRARFSLIVLKTLEEERALRSLEQVCAKRGRPLLTWDIGDGFVARTKNAPIPSSTLDPLTALSDIEKSTQEGVFALLDFHDCWQIPPVKRKLRTLAERLKYTKKSLVIISAMAELPNELKNAAVVIDYSLPDNATLSEVLSGLASSGGGKLEIDPQVREEIIRAALGLTALQAQRAFARAIVNDGKLDASDIKLVLEEKKQVIRQSRALEFCDTSETIENVGGLEVLKEWLTLRGTAFSDSAKEYGLQPPKGIALIGISGTGKSLTAKLIAGMWHVPLLRLDMGAIFQKWYGESEENARVALRTAEAVAPCVMWIDEIEKGLSQGDGDSGTSSRVFGTILTWMQEKKAPVFVVATANDISKIPPELFRRGRFDEIFFLDLPTAEERRSIFKVHLAKRNRDASKFDLDKLTAQSDGYVGAEIEQSIIDAMIVAFHQKREFTSEDIASAIKRSVPLSVSQRGAIAELQKWLDDGRAQPASSHGGGEKERARLRTQLGFH